MMELTHWEKYYLTRSYIRPYVTLPRNSPVTDRLLEHGLIHRVGLACGRYVDWGKTALGNQVTRELVAGGK